MAKEIIETLHYSSLTALVEQLIRDEYEKRIHRLEIHEKKPVAGVGIRPHQEIEKPELNEKPARYKIPRK